MTRRGRGPARAANRRWKFHLVWTILAAIIVMRTRSGGTASARLLVLLLTAGALLGAARAAHAADGQKQVLVLYATRRDAQIAVVGDRELPRMLDAGLQRGLDYYAEYIDRARFPDPQYKAAFGDFLRLKYKGQRFDLVIAIQDIAIDFIGEVRRELFPDTPIVFFTNSPSTGRIANSTGVIAGLDLGATVVLANELQPDLRHVFVVSGVESADKVYERAARAQLASYEPRLTVTYLSGLPTRDLESRLAALPGKSMVFYLLVTRDGAGENFQPLEYVDRVTAAANAPTYSWVDSTMSHGIVGGSLKDQEAQIQAIATIALRVLNGEQADSIPLSSHDLNVRQVDWRQLRRWGISEARVPVGTRILFREPTAWERYKVYIMSATALILAQAVLIAGLLVQRAGRRRAEVQLRASQAELRVIYTRLLAAEEGERVRIARELHDDIGQRMAALTVELDLLGARPSLEATDLRTSLKAVSGRAVELAKDIQSTSRVLHSSQLAYLSLASAGAAFCRGVSNQQGLPVDFTAGEIPDDLPKDVALCVFRVLQEAVNNALKHAGARHVTVGLRDEGEELRLEVADDGTGFDRDAAMNGSGLGLISMQERLTIVGGELTIDSRPGTGATIRARVPWRASAGRPAGATA